MTSTVLYPHLVGSDIGCGESRGLGEPILCERATHRPTGTVVVVDIQWQFNPTAASRYGRYRNDSRQ